MLRCGYTAVFSSLLVLALAGCSALGFIDAMTPRDTYLSTPNLAYSSDPRAKLDVYTPRSPEISSPRGGYPVVVFFYGGTWVSGERGDYRFIGEALASRGIVAIVADYRLYPQVRYPD